MEGGVKKILPVVLLLLMVISLSAQNMPDSSFHFSGHVHSRCDSSEIPNVHVLNQTKGTGTITSVYGGFELNVRNNDTLKFSCIGHKERYLIIVPVLQRENIKIYLQQDTVLMDEVLIHPLGPRRFFKYQFLSLELPEPEYEMKMNENAFRPKNDELIGEPVTGIHFTGPVQALYNVFNKQKRLQRKLERNRRKYGYGVVEGDTLN